MGLNTAKGDCPPESQEKRLETTREKSACGKGGRLVLSLLIAAAPDNVGDKRQ